MKTLLMISAAALALATSASAQIVTASPGASVNSPHTATATVGNVSGGAGGLGGAGGTAIAAPITNVSPDIRTTVSPTITVRPDITTTDINVNDLSNRNTNGQGQLQGQQQATSSSATGGAAFQTQSTTSSATTGASTSQANNAGNNQSTTVDAHTNQVRQTATAYAPPVVNNAPCSVGGALGAQGPGFGISLGGSKVNKACDARAMAQVLFQIGEREAAVQYLSAFDPKVSAAVTRARTSK